MHKAWSCCVAVVLLGALACDSSKAELDQTKSQLQAVTAERDALKTQVSSLQTTMTAMQQQLADANAKLAAAQPSPVGRDTRGSRSPSSTHPQQPGSQDRQPPMTQEQKDAQHEMTGRSSMNN